VTQINVITFTLGTVPEHVSCPALTTAEVQKGNHRPVTSLHSPIAKKLAAFVALSNVDLAALDEFHRRQKIFPAGSDIVYEGQTKQSAFILADGWACSYKLLSDGRRQIVDFQIPGDVLGLRSILFRTADHNIQAITPIEVSEITTADLLEGFGNAPRLATAILWAASREEAMVVEHLVDIGRRDAKHRMAHFLLELGARLKIVGLATSAGYACPLSQSMFGDALGLTAVHVNRVLRDLREAGLATVHHGEVVFHDYPALVRFAEFDTSYLDHDGPLMK
jgi:CRP-like cAMP-binding protein